MKKSIVIWRLYKAIHSIVPCIMLTMSVGMIYSFSLFIPELTETIGASRGVVQFSFNLSIFFLGMGAAFFGPMVEKDIRFAAKLATVLFFGGLLATSASVFHKSVFLLYCGIGVMCGIGEGIAYLCPCKNMILWYSKSKFKGLVMAVSIVTFGLGSSLCAYLYGIIHPVVGLFGTLVSLAGVYCLMMTIGCLLIRKPKFDKFRKRRDAQAEAESDRSKCLSRKRTMLSYLKDPYVRSHWVFMFLNISMGLILIGSCASILKDAGLAIGTVVLVMSICGITNGLGRIIFPLVGDMMTNKGAVIAIILGFEVAMTLPVAEWYWLVPISVICINATYGGGFATCPQIVLERYGTKPLSVIHGLLLSAWGIASLFAYCITMMIERSGFGYRALPVVLGAVYAAAVALTRGVWSSRPIRH